MYICNVHTYACKQRTYARMYACCTRTRVACVSRSFILMRVVVLSLAKSSWAQVKFFWNLGPTHRRLVSLPQPNKAPSPPLSALNFRSLPPPLFPPLFISPFAVNIPRTYSIRSSPTVPLSFQKTLYHTVCLFLVGWVCLGDIKSAVTQLIKSPHHPFPPT